MIKFISKGLVSPGCQPLAYFSLVKKQIPNEIKSLTQEQ